MKNTLKLVTLLLAGLFTTDIIAQTTFGLKAGTGFSTAKVETQDEDYSDDLILKPTFMGGFTLDFAINEALSIESGLQFANRGVMYREYWNNWEYREITNLFYVDLPILFKAAYVTGNTKLYIAGGPYVGAGVLGKVNYKNIDSGDVDESDNLTIKWGNDYNKHDLHRLDYGIDFRLGAEIGKVQLGLYNQFGLADISTSDYDGHKSNNRSFGVSIAILMSGEGGTE